MLFGIVRKKFAPTIRFKKLSPLHSLLPMEILSLMRRDPLIYIKMRTKNLILSI